MFVNHMTAMSDGSITRFKSEEVRFAALDTVSTAVCSGSFAESGNLVPLSFLPLHSFSLSRVSLTPSPAHT